MSPFPLTSTSLLDYNRYLSLLVGNDAFVPAPINAYDLLLTEIIPGSQASVTFSDLNSTYGSTYQHLQIRMVARSDEAGSSNLRDLRIQVNADTGTNYSAHVLRGDGAGIYSNAAISQNSVATATAMLPRPSNPTTQFGAAIIDVLDAFESSKNTTFRIVGGAKPDGEDQVFISGGAWLNTNALTEIKIFANSGNLGENSRFSLYGLRVA